MRLRLPFVLALVLGATARSAGPAAAQPSTTPAAHLADFDSAAFHALLASVGRGFSDYRLEVQDTGNPAQRGWSARPAFTGTTGARILERADGSGIAYSIELAAFPTGGNWANVFAALGLVLHAQLATWEEVHPGDTAIRWNECTGGAQGRVVLLRNRAVGGARVIELVVGRNGTCDAATIAATARRAAAIDEIDFMLATGEWTRVGEQVTAMLTGLRAGSTNQLVWMRQDFDTPQRPNTVTYDSRLVEWRVDCRNRSMTGQRYAALLREEVVDFAPMSQGPVTPGAGTAGAELIQRVCGAPR